MLAIGSFVLTLIFGLLLSLFSASRLTQVIGKAAFDPEKEARGRKLLKDWLSPEQLKCYEKNRFFDVVGSDTATVYRIHHGTQTNIEELDSIGKPILRWCFVPLGNLVAGDVMLAQKIALETNERGARAVANRSPGSYPTVLNQYR